MLLFIISKHHNCAMPQQVVLGNLYKTVSHGKKASGLFQFLQQVPALTSCFGFPQWWTVVWTYEENKLFFFTSWFWSQQYKENRNIDCILHNLLCQSMMAVVSCIFDSLHFQIRVEVLSHNPIIKPGASGVGDWYQ